jgi:hypothetical protein
MRGDWEPAAPVHRDYSCKTFSRRIGMQLEGGFARAQSKRSFGQRAAERPRFTLLS